MKKTLLSLSLITFALFGKAQDCSDLIISEYLEGTGNNKALEIYNTSSSPINLSNYRILRHDNGNTSFTAVEGEMQLPTFALAPYTAYVIALDLTDPSGTGQTAPIDPALEAAADVLLCPGCASGNGTSRVMCFNGDDALALQKNVAGSWVNIDIFACRGEQPTNSGGTVGPTAAWTSIAPYSSMPAGYNTNYPGVPYFKQYWTQDKTLRRKGSIKAGVSVNPALGSFNPSVEWDSTAVNNFTDLGSHVCDCSLATTLKENAKAFDASVFPNPSKNTIQVNSINFINKIVLTSVTGQIVKTVHSSSNLSGSHIDIADFSPGVYFMSIYDTKDIKITKRVIVQ